MSTLWWQVVRVLAVYLALAVAQVGSVQAPACL